MTTRFQSFNQSRMGAFSESRLGARCGEDPEAGNVVVVIAYQDEAWEPQGVYAPDGRTWWFRDVDTYIHRRTDAIEAGYTIATGVGHIEAENPPPSHDPIYPVSVDFPYEHFQYRQMARSPTLADHVAFFESIINLSGLSVTNRSLYRICTYVDNSGSMVTNDLGEGYPAFIQWLQDTYPQPEQQHGVYEDERWVTILSVPFLDLPVP